ncbi:MAG: RAMP superfamily CRISPR-associated protein [Desulfobacca sp.]|nr:RAMP superfamily CRISPR-associated protein [Desulfobacca sp.]
MAASLEERLENLWRAFFRADLVLDSALHIGAGGYDDSRGIATCYRDARGQAVILGTSLAGVFMEDVLQAVNDPRTQEATKTGIQAIQKKITCKGLNDLEGSRFIFHNARPLEAQKANRPWDRRDSVRIDRQTRTAAYGAKFAHEVLEPGLRFRFYFECAFYPHDKTEQKKTLTALALKILQQRWGQKNSPAFLGAAAARGTGWFHLENLQAAVIADSDGLQAYLNAEDIKSFVDDHPNYISLAEIQEWSGDLPLQWPRQVWNFQVQILDAIEDGYGAWPLLVRSAPEKGLLNEEDLTFVSTRVWKKPDDNGKQKSEEKLFIPGSTLRGAARSFMERLAASGKLNGLIQEKLNALFGPEDCSSGSRLRFRDAYFENPGKPNQIVHHVALDEFTRGALEGAKFDEKPLFSGNFDGQIILEYPDEEEKKLIETLFAWGQQGWVALGAHHTPVRWKLIAGGPADE